MGVYKRSKVYWYRFTFRGKQIRKSTRQGNKRVAEQMEAAHKTSLAKAEVGIVQKGPAPTLGEFASRFLDEIHAQCGSKLGTVAFYEAKLQRLLKSELANKRLDEIDEKAVDAYKQKRKKDAPLSSAGRPVKAAGQTISAATVNRELATLRRLVRLAQEWRIIDRVPRIRLLRGERNREFVLPRNLEATYLGALPEPTASVATLLLDTGLRVGEALKLDWADVRLDPAGSAQFGHLTVRSRNSKNSKARHVPLSARVQELLAELDPQERGLVFRRDDGKPIKVTHLDHQHSRVRAMLKLPADFVLHSLRHTFGTRLGEAGADAFTIMRLMGHSSVTVSQRYVHPSPETVELAFARLEKLNQAQSETDRAGVGTKLGTVAGGSAHSVQ